MLLPQTKEREYRFGLALRMGLPIFALFVVFIVHTFLENSATLDASFYVESLILLVFSIYFFLYLIYSGFDVKITDDVSKTFTREYLFKYIKKELKHKDDYSLILISIDNLNDINKLYGIKNGDKVLEEVALWVANYFKEQKIENFPLGHIKGGDFIIGLNGKQGEYSTMLELMCLKSGEFKVGDIEIKLSGAISDTEYAKELDYIVEHLFELQEERRGSKIAIKHESMNPNELESLVINAIEQRSLSIMTQNIYENEEVSFKECFVKLKSPDGKLLYPKSYTKIINKLGLGVEYDLMVLEEITSHVKVENSTYALNISPSSLRNEKFLSRAKELIKNINFKVMFVLSESEYFSHTSRYNSIIRSLKQSGALIAIDRLGSIHTSFLYMRELEIDLVRFDSYYSNEEKLKEYGTVLDGFNMMAHAKGIKSWIKNIQDEKSLDLVQKLDVDYIQGKELSALEQGY